MSLELLLTNGWKYNIIRTLVRLFKVYENGYNFTIK